MYKIFIFLVPLFLFFGGVDVALAQSVAPGGLVSCNGWECSACDLVKMANVIILWLFGIIFLIFAALMMVAGFGLVTSGGNQSALEAAKSKFKNGIIGILIVMAAWLLVDTVMKGLVGGGSTGVAVGEIAGWGPWSEVKCQLQTQTQEWPGDPASPSASTTPPTPLPGPAAQTCSGSSCVPIGIPCANQNSCKISPDLAPKLQAMHAAAGVAGARVTEGMPPTRPHKSVCHNQGTCVDYSKQGGMTAAEVVSVINAAKANGLRPVYEVKTAAEKTALVNAGAPDSSILVLGNWISGAHFSIYGY